MKLFLSSEPGSISLLEITNGGQPRLVYIKVDKLMSETPRSTFEVDTRDREHPKVTVEVTVGGKPAYR